MHHCRFLVTGAAAAPAQHGHTAAARCVERVFRDVRVGCQTLSGGGETRSEHCVRLTVTHTMSTYSLPSPPFGLPFEMIEAAEDLFIEVRVGGALDLSEY